MGLNFIKTYETFTVFHGTRNEFDKFSLDNLDSGVGTQGFGYGLYFSDVRSVAKSYANTLESTKNSELIIDNTKIISEVIKEFVVRAAKTHGKNPKLLLHILKTYNDKLNLSDEEHNLIKNAKTLSFKRGRIYYQVEINDDSEDFLTWNMPVSSKHREKVMEQCKIENYNGRVTFENGMIYKNLGGKIEITKGSDFYRAFAGDKDFSEKKASALFLRAGIAGIKYPSESGKRLSDVGLKSNEIAYDYVVFDPNSITIKKKYKY